MPNSELIENIENKLDTLDKIQNLLEHEFVSSENNIPHIFDSYRLLLKETMEGIKEYLLNKLGSSKYDDFGKQYLKLLGLLNCVKLQQLAISELLNLHSIKHDYKHDFTTLNYIISNVCNHTIKNKNEILINSTLRNQFDDGNIMVQTYNPKTYKYSATTRLDYYKMIMEHLEELNDCLDEIIKMYPQVKAEN